MNTKKNLRPEDIIVGTDPVAIDIIQQIYSAIKDKSESERTFLERCWVLGIEKAYKTDTKKLDPELCTNLLERIYFHLEHKNIWEVEEGKLYDIFEKIISLKTLKDHRIQDIFTNLENALSDVLQLDFSNKVALSDSLQDKRNIFNYIVFFFNSIIEKIEISMVSVKAINAYFTLLPEVTLIVTNASGKVRFVNASGHSLLQLNPEESSIGMDIKGFISNYNKLIAKYKKEKKVVDFKTTITANVSGSKTIAATITIPEMQEDRSEIDEIVFVIKPV
jgi:hypothetical protein